MTEPGRGWVDAPLSGEILVIGFHKQRPMQDYSVLSRLSESIEREHETYTKAARSGRPINTYSRVAPYQDIRVILWGEYDRATLFIAEDVRVVSRITTLHSADAREYMFGPLYSLPDNSNSVSPRSLERLLSRPPAMAENRQSGTKQTAGLLGITCLKLSPALLACYGGRVRRSAADHIWAKGLENKVDTVILKSWSWWDLVVVSMADTLENLTDTIRSFERLTVKDLVPTPLLDEDVPGDFMRKERIHPPSEHRFMRRLGVLDFPPPGSTSVDQNEAPIFVQARTHLGIHEAALEQRRTTANASGTRAVLAEAFRPTDGPLPTSDAIFTEFHKWYQAKQSDSSAIWKWTANIRLTPKVGHETELQDRISRINRELNLRMFPRTIIGSSGTMYIVEFLLPRDDLDSLLTLVALAACWRVLDDLRTHLQDALTDIERWKDTSERFLAAHAKRPPKPPPDRLFDLVDRDSRGEKEILNRKSGLRRFYRRTVRSLLSNINLSKTKPASFLSILDLQGPVDVLKYYLCQQQEPIDPWTEEYLVRITESAQHAHHQLLQFSPEMKWSPPLRTEVPYGTSGLVSMVSAICGSIFALADSPIIAHAAKNGQGKAGASQPERPRLVSASDAVLVLLGASPLIQITNVQGETAIVEMSVMQALQPSTLCLLFHELGHWIEGRALPRQLVQVMEMERQDKIQEIVDVIANLFPEPKADGARPRDGSQNNKWLRINRFHREILHHSVWRMLGAKNDWNTFSTQFLFTVALGVNQRPLSPDNHIPWFDSWADSLAHLAVQRALFEGNESLHKAGAMLLDAGKRKRILSGILMQAQRFLTDDKELHLLIERLLHSVWLVVLVKLGDEWTKRRWPNNELAHSVIHETGQALMSLERRIFQEDDEGDTAGVDTKRGLVAPTSLRDVEDRLAQGYIVIPSDRLLSKSHTADERAFLWVRQVICATTNIIHDLTRRKTVPPFSRSIVFDERTELDQQLDEGIFLREKDGFVVIGAEMRRNFCRLQSAVLESLSEVAYLIQFGRLHRWIQRREFRRPCAYKAALSKIGSPDQHEVLITDETRDGLGGTISSPDRTDSVPFLRDDIVLLSGPFNRRLTIKWCVTGPSVRFGAEIVG